MNAHNAELHFGNVKLDADKNVYIPFLGELFREVGYNRYFLCRMYDFERHGSVLIQNYEFEKHEY